MSQPIINLTMSIEKMQVNVSQLLKEPIGSSRSHHIEERAGKDEVNCINGDVILIRTNRGIMVKGQITAYVNVICSRCLKSIDCAVKFDFEEEALPELPEDLSSVSKNDYLVIDEGHTLDPSEAILQYAWLNVPAKPLCRLDCAGICPACGHDLNEEPCQCPTNDINPRWSKLIRGRSSRS